MPHENEDVIEELVEDSVVMLDDNSEENEADSDEDIDTNYFEEVGLDDLFENIELGANTGVDADHQLFEVNISIESKALQKASQLITDFGLRSTMLDFLTDLFTRHRYPSTKAAIERFIQRGGTEDKGHCGCIVPVILEVQQQRLEASSRFGYLGTSEAI